MGQPADYNMIAEKRVVPDPLCGGADSNVSQRTACLASIEVRFLLPTSVLHTTIFRSLVAVVSCYVNESSQLGPSPRLFGRRVSTTSLVLQDNRAAFTQLCWAIIWKYARQTNVLIPPELLDHAAAHYEHQHMSFTVAERLLASDLCEYHFNKSTRFDADASAELELAVVIYARFLDINNQVAGSSSPIDSQLRAYKLAVSKENVFSDEFNRYTSISHIHYQVYTFSEPKTSGNQRERPIGSC